MLSIGDIQIYVTDFERALRFWAEGLQLHVGQKDVSQYSAFARLDFPDDGPSIRLFGGAVPPESALMATADTHPTIRFDIITSELEDTLVRLLDHGGEQIGEIESDGELRVVTVADPDGNTFDLLEMPEEGEE